METIQHLLPWHWFVLGVILIISEMLLSTGHALWFGISALIVSVLLWLIPGLNWELQIVIFAILSIVSVMIYNKYSSKKTQVTDSPSLNRRSESYVGRVFTLEEPIVNGIGKIRVEDSIWRVSGADQDINTNVKVIAVSGSTLEVTPA